MNYLFASSVLINIVRFYGGTEVQHRVYGGTWKNKILSNYSRDVSSLIVITGNLNKIGTYRGNIELLVIVS